MVVIELAGDAPLPRDLAAGGVFVPDCVLPLAAECDLVVCGASHQLLIPARVVYVDVRGGAGLELLGFSPEMKAQLVELATPASASSELPQSASTADPVPPVGGGASGGPEPVAQVGPPLLDDDAAALPDDDLAIPVSDEADAVATISDPGPRTGEPMFSYVKPGLAYRGGVARRTEPEAADEAEAAEARSASAEAGDAGPAIVEADGVYGDAPAGDEVDATGGFTEALAAELDAELGLGDFADADAPDRSEASLELDLIPTLDDGSPALAAGQADDDREGDDDPDASPGAPGGRSARARFALNVNERLRGLTLAAQIKVATQGELHERIVLERHYGKNVWEALLRNPRLTAPEVSRIARYGSLPRILLEIIVGNNAWLQIPEVRRALLSNPRLGVDQIMKVLRVTPKHELKLAAIQTAYPHAVRNAAKTLMRGDP